MLIPIDQILYSDSCQVFEVIPNEFYVYPIFKNASTSIITECKTNKCKIYSDTEIQSIQDITVYIRNPRERFKSGLQTVIFNLQKENPELDSNTIDILFQRYLFLDRHILPQFNWLLNLSRFTNPSTRLTLKSMTNINEITSNYIESDKINDIIINEEVFQNLYLQLDTCLYNLIGQSLTFKEIVSLIKSDNDAQFDSLLAIPLNLSELLK
jgi:hypothetical protein